MNKKISNATILVTVTKLYQITKSFSRRLLVLETADMLLATIQPFANIVLPKYIIDELLSNQRVEYLVGYIMFLIFTNMAIRVVRDRLSVAIYSDSWHCLSATQQLVGEKTMEMDYQLLENARVLDMHNKALDAMRQRGIHSIISRFLAIISQLITTIGIITILSSTSLLLWIVLTVSTLIQLNINRRISEYELETRNEREEVDRKYQIYKSIAGNYTKGKEIRLFDAANFISQFINKCLMEVRDVLVRQDSKRLFYTFHINVISGLQQVFLYGYMSFRLFQNSITLGIFFMNINAANTLANSLTNLIENYVSLKYSCIYSSAFFDYLEIPNVMPKGSLPVPRGTKLCLEFRNVSFKYPNTSKLILKNVSFSIESGKSLSVVGLNGAGKTTLIKLMMRLYDPDEGEILINGVNIKEYCNEEYAKLFSVIFQDYNLYRGLSIRENIAFTDDCEQDEHIYKVLRKSGLYEKIKDLPSGLGTLYGKGFAVNSIELSGGQSQRLALARCMQMDAPILILDEPTSALDPIAEYELYKDFYDNVQNKTAIFISHRLASCRFCDEILVLEKGELVEHGTHKELMAKHGRYYSLFSIQASKYETTAS